jgi:hypothetical protein
MGHERRPETNMHKAQLAIIPMGEGRRAERRLVNLAASLREPGATVADAEVLNLSTTGYMAVSDMELVVGAAIWLKLPGHEALKSIVIWVEDGKAGFEFMTPLHPAILDQLTAATRKTPPRKHFGPQAGWR